MPDGTAAGFVLVNLFVLMKPNHVTWERVRAAGRIAGWSSALPISIGLLAEVVGNGPADGFPGWIRLWVFACWAAALLVCLASVALRRRTPAA